MQCKELYVNYKILPLIVEAVLLCARQKIALQGHQQDKIDFALPAMRNEGNFIAMLRLLSKNNATLHEHLTFGAKNAKYTSKTIQNEILGIAADQIRGFYRSCLHRCSHFSLIADEVISHGKEMLSVCLRFLEIDHNNFHVKPEKHEVLLDFRFLERITGQCIVENILHVLELHNIDIRNCRGQAYDTTASMSSNGAGVQAFIRERTPDAEFQGMLFTQFKFGHMPFIANSSCSKHDGELPTSIPFLSQFTEEIAFL